MKHLYDIGQRVQTLNKEISKLQLDIIDTLEWQRDKGLRPNKDCDAITGRETRIAVIEGEIRGLKWVIDEDMKGC